jgi:hypothetical protein
MTSPLNTPGETWIPYKEMGIDADVLPTHTHTHKSTTEYRTKNRDTTNPYLKFQENTHDRIRTLSTESNSGVSMCVGGLLPLLLSVLRVRILSWVFSWNFRYGLVVSLFLVLYSVVDLCVCVCVGRTSASIPISLYGIQVSPGVFRGEVMFGDYNLIVFPFWSSL